MTKPTPAGRSPMDPAGLRRRLGPDWSVEQVAETGSTNADLAARSGPGPLTVLIAQAQTVGRGRLGRSWTSPPGAGLLFSVRMWVPEVPSRRRGWVGVLLGLAIAEALDSRSPVPVSLKWPNDVLLGGRKCAGILGEVAGDAVVVGAGINVSLDRSELPRPDATSLVLAGGRDTDRQDLLADILLAFGSLTTQWRAVGGDVMGSELGAQYRRRCSTLGRSVRVELPGAPAVSGVAVDIDPAGSIVLRTADDARLTFAAGDVVHLRAAGAD